MFGSFGRLAREGVFSGILPKANYVTFMMLRLNIYKGKQGGREGRGGGGVAAAAAAAEEWIIGHV